jgi:hypothetical protein
MCECGVPEGALKLNSTGYPDHDRYGDFPLQETIPTGEPGIEPGSSWLVVRSSDHQATRLVSALLLQPTFLEQHVFWRHSLDKSTNFRIKIRDRVC